MGRSVVRYCSGSVKNSKKSTLTKRSAKEIGKRCNLSYVIRSHLTWALMWWFWRYREPMKPDCTMLLEPDQERVDEVPKPNAPRKL
jgi:hypothetical protein